MRTTDTEYLEMVRCFCGNPSYFDYLVLQYRYILIWIGKNLEKKADWFSINERYAEVAEFLDGHNFIVKYLKDKYTSDIVLIPQYGGPNDQS